MVDTISWMNKLSLKIFFLNNIDFHLSLLTHKLLLRSVLLYNCSVLQRGFGRTIFLILFHSFTHKLSNTLHNFYFRFLIRLCFFIYTHHISSFHLSNFVLRFGHTFNNLLHDMRNGNAIIISIFILSLLTFILFIFKTPIPHFFIGLISIIQI